MAQIELVGVCKKLTDDPGSRRREPGEPRPAFMIRDLNLTIPDGRTVVVLGPSGCGKTTLLKLIAGLIPVDSGQILFGGRSVENTPAKERGIGMVFQNYALFPHFTSRSNILTYFLFRKKTPALDRVAEEKLERTSELLGVEIKKILDRKPGRLSGGERQRVALARCITRDPHVFLLDEPFANLDQRLRERYRVNLKMLLNQFNVTTVYVTHDQQEALVLADLVAIMDNGNIVQIGTYEEIYSAPKNVFVSEFLNLDIDTPAVNLIDGGRVGAQFEGRTLGARPEDIQIVTSARGPTLEATVVDVRNIVVKDRSIVTTRSGDLQVVVQTPSVADVKNGDRVRLHLSKYHLFDANTGERVSSRASAA